MAQGNAPAGGKAAKADKPVRVQDVMKRGGWRNVVGGPVQPGMLPGNPPYVEFANQGQGVSWVRHGQGVVDRGSIPEGSTVVPLPRDFEFPEDGVIVS